MVGRVGDVYNLGSLKVIAFKLKNVKISDYDVVTRGVANLFTQFKLKNTVIELKVRKESVDIQTVVKNLERDIAVLRIILESDPTNVRVERKLRTYEEIYKAFLNGVPPARLSIYVLGFSHDEGELKEEVSKFVEALAAMLGAEIERIKGRDIIRKAILPIKDKGEVGTSDLLSLAIQKDNIPPPLVGPVVLGYEMRTGEVVGLNEDMLKKHLLVVGSTGSGKTTLLASLAIRVRDIYDVKVIGIDPKGDLSDMLRAEGFEVGNDVKSDIINTEDEEEINRIIQYLRKSMRVSKRGSRLHTLLLVDEAWKVGLKKIDPILREGRSRGIGVVLATHSLKDLDPRMLVNVNLHVIMKTDRNELKGMPREVIEEAITLNKGEALVGRGREYLKVRIVPVRRLLQ